MMKMIDSLQNPSVKKWKKLHTKKEREKTNSFLVEGFHLVEEALKSDAEITTIIVEQETNLPHTLDLSNVSMTYVSNQVMKTISETETPQGIIAVCKKQKTADISSGRGQKWLLLDRIQDPGNVGTMIRTADAAGLDGVLLSPGCADIYNAKTIRATQGSLFHIPVVTAELTTWINTFKEDSVPVYGTALEGGVPYQEMDSNPERGFALIVGNEGSGVDESLLSQTDKNLYVPIYGKAESLNVSLAAGILLYYLRG
jgi:RNA methyltransferase, TrmH family